MMPGAAYLEVYAAGEKKDARELLNQLDRLRAKCIYTLAK
jgi:hypothetical protein